MSFPIEIWCHIASYFDPFDDRGTIIEFRKVSRMFSALVDQIFIGGTQTLYVTPDDFELMEWKELSQRIIETHKNKTSADPFLFVEIELWTRSSCNLFPREVCSGYKGLLEKTSLNQLIEFAIFIHYNKEGHQVFEVKHHTRTNYYEMTELEANGIDRLNLEYFVGGEGIVSGVDIMFDERSQEGLKLPSLSLTPHPDESKRKIFRVTTNYLTQEILDIPCYNVYYQNHHAKIVIDHHRRTIVFRLLRPPIAQGIHDENPVHDLLIMLTAGGYDVLEH